MQHNPAIDLVGQDATVEAHVISRGRFQYVLTVADGPNAGRYIPETELAEEYCEDGLLVRFDAELLRKKGVVYKPGATDIPEKDFELPMIRLLGIKKR